MTAESLPHDVEVKAARLDVETSEEINVATKQIPLTKTRNYITKVDLGLRDRESDAGWSTPDGYVVHRTYDTWGNPEYWVRQKNGVYSLQDGLDGAREAIDWLRTRGR